MSTFLFWRETAARGLYEMLRTEDETDWPHLSEQARARYRAAAEELARTLMEDARDGLVSAAK